MIYLNHQCRKADITKLIIETQTQQPNFAFYESYGKVQL